MSERTILLKGDPPQFESKAYAAITPGDLLELYTTSGYVRQHATAGANAMAMFAIENALEGDEIGTDYDAGDVTQYVHARPGDEIYAWLAGNQSVAINDYLESAGAGDLQKHTTNLDSAAGLNYPNAIVAVALEAVDSTDSASTHERIKVRIV